MSKPSGMGNVNQTLITGRTTYVYDGTDLRPTRGDTDGNIKVSAVKTVETELRAAAAIAASTQALSSVLDLAGIKKATFIIDHARGNTVAFTDPGTEYRIETSAKATGNDAWAAMTTWSASSAACSSAAASSDCAAGTTIVKITSGTAMVASGWICFTSGTIEWVKPVAVSGTASFTVQDATTYAHVSATGMFSGAEKFVVSIDAEPHIRARVVTNNNASASTNPIFNRISCITEK